MFGSRDTGMGWDTGDTGDTQILGYRGPLALENHELLFIKRR